MTRTRLVVVVLAVVAQLVVLANVAGAVWPLPPIVP
jgi:hypothetical protein